MQTGKFKFAHEQSEYQLIKHMNVNRKIVGQETIVIYMMTRYL